VTPSDLPRPAGSDQRVATRQCPTTVGDHRPLIAQNIAIEVCQGRQREMYHKCHRCLYRGKPAAFVAERGAPAETLADLGRGRPARGAAG
jgi:hypothetical protein